jgi:ribonuclease P protein component
MFKKENRLTKNKEFDNVWQAGQSSFDKNLGVKAVKNNLKINRFGILVGIKVSKKATERNKLKRRIREAAVAQLEKLKPGFDIVIIAQPVARDKEFVEIEKSVKDNFKRLKLFK